MTVYHVGLRYPGRKWAVTIKREGVSATVWDDVTADLRDAVGPNRDASAPMWRGFKTGKAAIARLLDVIGHDAKVTRHPRQGWTVETTYGNRRDYRKIDIYLKRPEPIGLVYRASTTWARTCREARERYAIAAGYAASDLHARYAER